MRWLKKYPIIADEVIETLNRIPDQEGIGGVGNMIKVDLIKFLQQPVYMSAFLEYINSESRN